MSAAALLIACTGVTPAEAVRAAKKVAFASDAGTVNKIKASRSPQPGQLLPLGSDGAFPASVLPSGARGPRGQQGPSGANGTNGSRGPSDIFINSRAGAGLEVTPQLPVAVATLAGVPAGGYLLQLSGSMVYQDSGAAGSSYWRCWFTVNGGQTKNSSVNAIGPESVTAASVSLQEGVTLTSTSTIRAMCQHDGPTPQGNPRLDQVSLSAIRTENLVNQ